jgi:hypothetical protein
VGSFFTFSPSISSSVSDVFNSLVGVLKGGFSSFDVVVDAIKLNIIKVFT